MIQDGRPIGTLLFTIQPSMLTRRQGASDNLLHRSGKPLIPTFPYFTLDRKTFSCLLADRVSRTPTCWSWDGQPVSPTVGGLRRQLRIGSSEEGGITSIPSPRLAPTELTLQIQTKAQGLRASGPWQAANPIPAGQQSVWLVAPAGM